MANGLTFDILNQICNFFIAVSILITFAKFQGHRFKIDGEIAGNHAILVDHF